MTRYECEDRLIKAVEEAAAVYRQYRPDGNGLTLTWGSDGYINVSDIHVITNEAGKWEIVEWTIDASKYSNGSVRHANFDSMRFPDGTPLFANEGAEHENASAD